MTLLSLPRDSGQDTFSHNLFTFSINFVMTIIILVSTFILLQKISWCLLNLLTKDFSHNKIYILYICIVKTMIQINTNKNI